jgi:hypothetical protein
MLAKLVLITCLLLIFYQDLRYRAVYWILFPMVLIALLVLVAQQQPQWKELLFNSSYNLAFLLLQFLLLFLYFSLKMRRWVNLTQGYLGWGDILFLLCIAFYLSPANYFLFYLISLLLIVFTTLLIVAFKAKKQIQIPLAGLQSMFFVLLLLADWNSGLIDMTNDYWLLTYLNL